MTATRHGLCVSLGLAFALLTGIPGLPSTARAQDRVPEAESPKAVKPGKVALLTAPKGMRYFLRVPKSYNPKRGARLIVFMHGSNMNGLSYLRSFETKRWGADDLLVCPNGEKGEDPYGANNFTFGSAPYVAEVTRAVQDAFRITRTYIGGHSQGGFVTYSVILRYPDLYDGALPMAGDCWMQNEPNLWEDNPDTLKQQKQIAIAVIHGKSDPVVKFSQGQHAYDVFLAMGYPKLRLLAPERLGHQFMLSPVPEALDWLDAMKGADPKKGLQLSAKWLREKEYGWGVQVAKGILEREKVSSSPKKNARNLLKKVEKVAAKEVKKMATMLEESPPEEWLPAFFEFRRQFGDTEVAAKLLKKYDTLRTKQREVGKRLFAQARGQFQADNREKGRELLRELLAEAPATYEAHYALKWLADE